MAPPSPRPETPIPDSTTGATDLPLSMSASVVLTSLPQDAHQALENAGAMSVKKGASKRIVTIRFKAVGSAPILQRNVFKINASQRFETVVNFLRTRLRAKREEAVFCYINNVFAPGLDEVVGNLWKCFKTDDQLIVSYSMTPAFG
ncbi:MAG: Ubiquitin-like protein [Vezdaea aestivalis]|nr:MAG: Ubiquitin-like protein [Vezdaea aestivalis]